MDFTKKYKLSAGKMIQWRMFVRTGNLETSGSLAVKKVFPHKAAEVCSVDKNAGVFAPWRR